MVLVSEFVILQSESRNLPSVKSDPLNFPILSLPINWFSLKQRLDLINWLFDLKRNNYYAYLLNRIHRLSIWIFSTDTSKIQIRSIKIKIDRSLRFPFLELWEKFQGKLTKFYDFIYKFVDIEFYFEELDSNLETVFFPSHSKFHVKRVKLNSVTRFKKQKTEIARSIIGDDRGE